MKSICISNCFVIHDRLLGSPLLLMSMFARRWLFGDVGCVFYAFWMTLLGVTTISLFTGSIVVIEIILKCIYANLVYKSSINIAVISICRYIIVCQSQFKSRLTPALCNLVGVGCFLHGLVWAVVPLTGIGHTGYVYEPAGLSCTPDWDPPNIGYISGLFTASFVLPVSIASFSFVQIKRKARRNRLRPPVSSRYIQMEQDLTVLCVVTMAMFLFSWTPYAVIAYLHTLGIASGIVTPELSLVPLVCAKTAGFWNPVIFSLKNKPVKEYIGTNISDALSRLRSALRCGRKNFVGIRHSRGRKPDVNIRKNPEDRFRTTRVEEAGLRLVEESNV
ncbi:rhodopsin, G0-coupled-like [Mya arenaria]|uniref:rhodopsin, G0-coupled-like n=1 Tax=Mya arenaria TaxID=6604 RepID=UPI0022E41BA3|nr:rhodopsin, G0-coupled-like [Mya arenaria]